MEEVQPLTEKSVIEYVKGSDLFRTVFDGAEDLKSSQITEGNVNLLFRVYSESDPDKSVIVKQALPYAWRYPDFKMPLDRSRIEYEVLKLEGKYCPEHVPEIYLYDPDRHVLVIEDLNHHLVMREGLMQRKRYPNVAKHIGTFMARTLFYTSDLYLPSGEKKAMLPKFINPVLCKVQEDLVFTQPYIDHPNNRWTPGLDEHVRRIHADDDLRSEIFMLKELYMTHAQAVIHNDLHTGSIMLNEEETKVVDPEFAFYGPMAHDVGTYLANLALNYAAQEYHSPTEEERSEYRRWLADLIRETWQVFEEEFLRLWEEDGNEDWPSDAFKRKYMHQMLQDTAGFGAAEMMRRLIGLAHVHDFWTIEDEEIRARAESIGLNIAESWIKNRKSVERIDDLVDMVVEARAD